MHLSRWLLGPALVLSLVSLPVIADAAPADPKGPASAGAVGHGLKATALAKPEVRLDGPLRGRAALAALGGKLSTAASINRTSEKSLKHVLAHDPTAWLSANGRLFYADRFDRPTTAARTSATATSIPPAPKPLSQTFLLHSIPGGADHTVYLDFNGVYLTAGGWTLNGWKAGTYQGFSLDSDYTAFSDAEKAYIQHVWAVVAEKYAPFDVDVTTQDPGKDAYNRSGPGDLTYGDHVVFTDVATGSGAKPKAVCPDGCDGISFTGSFNDPDDNLNLGEPTWVYTNFYHWYSGMAGEIAAHEIGHTLGLSHDGLGTGDGDYGSGNDAYYQGDDLWSPVMGAGYGALTQFSKGEYQNASNTEDDFAVMQTFGVSQRADDWGDPGSPSALNQATSYEEQGVLEDAADKDVFSIDRTCTTPLRVRAAGIGAGQTADLKLRVLDAAGSSVLGSDDPSPSDNTSSYPRIPGGVDAEVTVASPPTGLIQIEVDGVGFGDPVTGGYSDYGSVGSYTLTISGCSGASGTTPGYPAGINATQTAKTGTLTVAWAAPASSGDAAVSGYRITGLPSGTVDVPASQLSQVFTGLIPGQDYDIGVAAMNQYGAGPAATTTKHLDTWVPTTAPKLSASASGTTVTLKWTEPTNSGRAVGTTWLVNVYVGSQKVDSFNVDYGSPGVKYTGVPPIRLTMKAQLFYTADIGTRSPTASKTFDVGPSAPRIGTASSGASGGTVNVTARWGAPSVLRGCKISAYYVIAYQLSSTNRVIRSGSSTARSASSRSYTWALPKGKFKFKVQARACGGYTDVSSYSNIVYSR